MIKLKKMSKMGERGPGAKGTRFLPISLLGGPAMGIISALLSNWKIGIFVILLATIAYQNLMSFEILRPVGVRTIPGLIQDHESAIKQAQEQVRIMSEQLVECELSRERLKDEITASNDQVNKWVNISNGLQQSQTKLSSALIDLKTKSSAELEIILQGPIPQTCEGAVKLLRDAVTKGDLSWN